MNCYICDGMSQYDRCSRNSACGCFHMIGADNIGISEFIWTSCSEFDLCESSSNTCNKGGHICVCHPQCNSNPICYPVSITGQ
jgi:hypothetical protein